MIMLRRRFLSIHKFRDSVFAGANLIVTWFGEEVFGLNLPSNAYIQTRFFCRNKTVVCEFNDSASSIYAGCDFLYERP